MIVITGPRRVAVDFVRFLRCARHRGPRRGAVIRGPLFITRSLTGSRPARQTDQRPADHTGQTDQSSDAPSDRCSSRRRQRQQQAVQALSSHRQPTDQQRTTIMTNIDRQRLWSKGSAHEVSDGTVSSPSPAQTHTHTHFPFSPSMHRILKICFPSILPSAALG